MNARQHKGKDINKVIKTSLLKLVWLGAISLESSVISPLWKKMTVLSSKTPPWSGAQHYV